MRILLTERFQRDVGSLASSEKSQIFDVMLQVPNALKNPHGHSGMGLRKLHVSGIFEARIGLGLRVVFGLEKDLLVFHRAGTHEEIQRYLKSL